MTPHQECECGNVEMWKPRKKQKKKSNKSTFAATGGKQEGDANESDKDNVGMSGADVKDSLNDDLQTKKIVDQTRAVRKSVNMCRRM
ncbi:conserved hypothetical protein [Culex quinquefasciatus]|uniref:Uncharacterized protein n=1 Tax=Culex quinquefasciatus TaxID=7176 RepID=B0X6U0_CULQU|nr:conserved hypothetical protein [Culex quinquefasciatus]|eukprot:XP_001865362.1 conserved hypothetical protein [Culex quinquefasciatus]